MCMKAVKAMADEYITVSGHIGLKMQAGEYGDFLKQLPS